MKNKINEGEGTPTLNIRKNLLSELEADQSFDNLREKLDKKKKFLKVEEKMKKENFKNELESDLNEKLNYIFDPETNVKKGYAKEKKSNSCKCAKSNCTKFLCSCLRNGLKCDFLCSCKNCENKQTVNLTDLLSHKSYRK